MSLVKVRMLTFDGFPKTLVRFALDSHSIPKCYYSIHPETFREEPSLAKKWQS